MSGSYKLPLCYLKKYIFVKLTEQKELARKYHYLSFWLESDVFKEKTDMSKQSVSLICKPFDKWYDFFVDIVKAD